MARISQREQWLSIGKPLHERVTGAQEEAIRGYARAQGYETLRGFWKVLEMWGWDYYDVLHEASP